MRLLYLYISLMGLLLGACNNQATKELKAQAQKRQEETKALTLLQATCFTCHSPEMGIPKRLAPPMFMVRNHYFDSTIKREDFVNKIVKWVNNPSLDNSIMPGAVRNFGLMPKQSFKEEDVSIIAGYIYDTDLESDAWYQRWEAFKTESKPKSE